MEREGKMQTYLVQLRGEDEDDGDDRFALAGRHYFLSSAPSSTFFFFLSFCVGSLCSVSSARSFFPLASSVSLRRNRGTKVCFFLPLVSPGSVVPPLFLCPVFSVQDEDDGDRTRCCWLMDQNFPWFCFSPLSPLVLSFVVYRDESNGKSNTPLYVVFVWFVLSLVFFCSVFLGFLFFSAPPLFLFLSLSPTHLCFFGAPSFI